jgi:hypothetical protein
VSLTLAFSHAPAAAPVELSLPANADQLLKRLFGAAPHAALPQHGARAE